MTTMRRSRLELRINKFVDALIAGQSQREAYKSICPRWKQMTDAQLDNSASQFARRPIVVSRYRSVLASTPLENILTGPEHMRTLIERAKTAFEAENYTASAAYDRIIAVPTGLIKDTQVTVNAWKSPDADLLRQLAGDDPTKQAAAAVLLGKSSFESDTIGPDRTESETKH